MPMHPYDVSTRLEGVRLRCQAGCNVGTFSDISVHGHFPRLIFCALSEQKKRAAVALLESLSLTVSARSVPLPLWYGHTRCGTVICIYCGTVDTTLSNEHPRRSCFVVHFGDSGARPRRRSTPLRNVDFSLY